MQNDDIKSAEPEAVVAEAQIVVDKPTVGSENCSNTAKATSESDANNQNTTVEPPTVSAADRLSAAESMVRKYALISAGIGFIPVPMIDFIGLTATQLKLLKSLGDLYGVQFSDEYAKKTIAALINGYAPFEIAPVVASVIKMVPFFGQIAGAVSMASVGGGITYGIGQVFIRHFESGGTFLTFDPKKVSEYFKSQFKVGAKLATASVKAA